MTGSTAAGQDFAASFAGTLTAAEDPARMAGFVLRTKSAEGLQVMARAATRGTLTYRELVDRSAGGSGPAEALDLPWLRHLARTVAILGEEAGAAVSLFELAARHGGLGEFEPLNADTYAQLLLRGRRLERLDQVLADLPMDDGARWSVRADRANPFLGPETDERAWLAVLNEVFGDLEPVTLEAEEDLPFDRLTSTAPAVPDATELVSVVMPVYRPDRSLLLAVRSVLAQSWRNLEVLIVDDASPEGYEDVFAEAAELDGRVRVVRAPVNGGTYPARNLGLQHAQGEYVTFQDADDWSHPRRLERQVRALQQHGVLATRSRAVRAYPDLSLTYVGYPAERLNASSLLFRREPVLAELGAFDPVRKSADMELPLRLRSVHRGSVLDMPGPPLAITQLRHGSLSRADATPGWIRWDRIAYRDAYQQWHKDIRNGRSNAYVHPHGSRPFPAPSRSWLPERTDAEPPRYDVVVLGDWRAGQPGVAQTLDDVALLQGLGLRVAIAHAETPLPLAERREALSPVVQRRLNDGDVRLAHLSEPGSTALLLVANPAVLQFHTAPATMGVGTVVAQLLDSDRWAEVELGFRAADCERHCQRVFGRSPSWLARDTRARHYLQQTAGVQDLLPVTLPVAVDSRALAVPPSRHVARPVVGCQPLERLPRVAGEADLLAVFPDDDHLDVRLRGRSRSVLQLLQTKVTPPGWLVFDPDEIDERSYLAQLDFFLYPFDPAPDYLAHKAVLAAMAAGCVVVLAPELQREFGDAALYAEPRAALEAAASIFTDQDRMAAQRRRAQQYARDQHQMFAREIRALTDLVEHQEQTSPAYGPQGA